jgi:hypothetical protein
MVFALSRRAKRSSPRSRYATLVRRMWCVATRMLMARRERGLFLSGVGESGGGFLRPASRDSRRSRSPRRPGRHGRARRRAGHVAPLAGCSCWTTRLLARDVGLTSGCVSDLLRRHGLEPHHVRTYKVSRDPAFVAKVRDVVGLYLDPPSTPWCSAWTRSRPSKRWSARSGPLLLRSGRATRPHDYNRHGVVDLYAALEGAMGQVTPSPERHAYRGRALREHLGAYMRAWDRHPTPLAWTKPARAIIRSHRRLLERISAAVH